MSDCMYPEDQFYACPAAVISAPCVPTPFWTVLLRIMMLTFRTLVGRE